MKNKFGLFVGLVFFTIGASAISNEVLNAAEDLAEAIEQLDSELHKINAPKDVIDLIHHSEDTVFEFVELLNDNAPPQTLKQEFEHVEVDVREIRSELKKHRFFNKFEVRLEFWHVWLSFRTLEFHFNMIHRHRPGHGGRHNH